MNIEELEKNIGYTFNNKQLLETALTHTSYAYEHGIQSNEKLEFLGDSILEFVSSEYMYNKYLNLKADNNCTIMRYYFIGVHYYDCF